MIAVVTDCPPETGGTRSEATEGVDSFRYRFFISRRGRKERKVLFPFRIPRWRWSGRKLRYDKSAQRVLATMRTLQRPYFPVIVYR